MKISPTSIFVSLVICSVFLTRFLYFIFVNSKRYPTPLFRGKFLVIFLIDGLLGLGAVFASLVLSHDFFYKGIFIMWGVLSMTAVCLVFVLWVMFWMHGYEARYQFNKVLLPAPISILTSFVILLSGLCTLNYYVIGISVVYAVLDYIWNYKGYLLTKPKIPDWMPVPSDPIE